MKTQTKICNTCGTERSLSDFYKVRSLVCDRCNRTMGACNDNSHVLKACATYLESHQESF